MHFDSPAQNETHKRVADFLAELFDEPFLDDENGHFYLRYGSTVLEIAIEPYGSDDAVVLIMAYCVQDVDLKEELLLGLLEVNHQLPLGSFSLVERDVFFSHSLLSGSLDARNLLLAIEAVATVSDDYDHRIIARYGGHTALEEIRETGGREARRRAGTDQ